MSRPAWVVLAIVLSALLSAVLARRLALHTEFSALLADDSPSVREYRRVAERLPWSSKILIVLEGGDSAALRSAGDHLVQKLKTQRSQWIVDAEDGVQPARRFLLPRALLFLDLPDLQRLVTRVDRLWQKAVAREAFDLGLDEVATQPEIDLEKWPELVELHARWDRYPDGYYQSPDRQALVVVVHTSLGAGQIEPSRRALAQISALVNGVLGAESSSRIRVGYAGDVVTGLSEYGAVRRDLLRVGVLGLGLVLASILLFYARLSALIALAAAVITGCAWTFAATQLLVGELNVATGFLFSIIAGNGINFAIILLGRYFDALRQGLSAKSAVELARARTYRATLTGALAAAAAYGSLYVSGFRALRQFAVIGALGMLLCWLATYLFLPSALLLLARLPTRASPTSASKSGVAYAVPFAWLVSRIPGWVLGACLLLGAISAAALAHSWGRDPMQYDMKQLFNQMSTASEQRRLSAVARSVIGVANESSMAIVCDRHEQVDQLTRALEKRRLEAPAGEKPFEAVHSIDDFVPAAQAEKIPLALRLRERLIQAYQRGIINDAQWRRLADYLPEAKMVPFGFEDLPAAVARPFTDRLGRRGGIVYVEPLHSADEDDVRYLMRWADSFRETRISDTETVLGSGRVVLFADMISAVLKDLPLASFLSLLMTSAVVLMTARRRSDAMLILGSLLTGVLWLTGMFVMLGLRLNFLNFVALPITFGIGVDYAVNIIQRYRENPQAGPVEALRKGGGAVILCSLTTSLGYLALLGSKNQAVQSLGLLAVLGELSCLLGAVLLLPSILALSRRMRPVNRSSEMFPPPAGTSCQ